MFALQQINDVVTLFDHLRLGYKKILLFLISMCIISKGPMAKHFLGFVPGKNISKK